MKWLIDPGEYTLANPRIDGWKKLREVHGRTVDIYVFPLEVFQYFREKQALPPEFVKALTAQAQAIITASPEHAAVVRRAFVVPGMENPPGPRFLGLDTPAKVVDAVRELYAFAVKQNYHASSDSQVSGWLEPPSTVLDLEQFTKDPAATRIPYGGYAINENGLVEILAVFGVNEGVQSLVADRYRVECRNHRYFVIGKDTPQKNLMLCTTNTAGTKLFPVPIDMQFDQVLSDTEIPEIARVVYELSQKYGPQRVEFSTDSQGVCFNEVADYFKEPSKETKGHVQIKGRVLAVSGLDDLKKLAQVSSAQLESGEVIVLVGEKVIADRDYDVLGALTTWKDHLYVLYPGVAATQHAMRVLADKGHRAFLIGNQKFSAGDQVQISMVGGKVRVTNLTKTESQETVSLWDAVLFGDSLCGGKANRLSQLKAGGFQVPHGVVCTTAVWDRILTSLGETKLTLDKFAVIQKKMTDNHSKLVAIIDQLLPDYRKTDQVFAVRSSATVEDGKRHSMAGMFDSYLNISSADLTAKIIQVLLSTFNPAVKKYLAAHPELASLDLKMAVIVQSMAPARAAGVIFGAKTQTGDTNLVEIEINNGLGEAVVSGTATEVEYYSFNRFERKIVERKGPKYITEPEARALFMLSERLRSLFSDTPQDIEWAIDTEGQIWVLQSRDLYLSPIA